MQVNVLSTLKRSGGRDRRLALAATAASPVQPGHSASLTVTMRPGSYDMYCPVGDHRARGMETHLTVGAAGTGSSSPGGSNTGGY